MRGSAVLRGTVSTASSSPALDSGHQPLELPRWLAGCWELQGLPGRQMCVPHVVGLRARRGALPPLLSPHNTRAHVCRCRHTHTHARGPAEGSLPLACLRRQGGPRFLRAEGWPQAGLPRWKATSSHGLMTSVPTVSKRSLTALISVHAHSPQRRCYYLGQMVTWLYI